MPVYTSIRRIILNKNVNRIIALYKYFIWQLIKKLNLFPREVKISNSRLLFKDKTFANFGGTLLYTQGMYDYNNMKFIQYLLKEGHKYFFDIGANMGNYTLIASEIESAIVYSFEPHPTTFKLLEENVELNNRKNVNLINLAVGKEVSHIKFTDIPGSPVNKVSEVFDNDDNYIKVKCTSLIEFCNGENIFPDIIKIDTEGYEMEILLGMGDILKDVKVVLIEISKDYQLINDFFHRNNFDGPYFSLYSEKIFCRNRSKNFEDPIYFSKNFMSDLTQNLNFTFEI